MSERSSRWASALVALLAVAASLTSIVNQFAYDDHYIIELNPVMRSLHGWWHVFQDAYWPAEWGGDGYRPLTILAFKIQWALGRGQPWVFHATNIVLYALVSMLVFLIARRVLPVWAAWISAALFAVHPVHVEAVANIVGQSELLVAAALLGATLVYFRARQKGELGWRTTSLIAALYALACFSKEHGIVLPGLLLACELTVVEDAASLRTRLFAQRWLYVALGAIAIGFVLIRFAVLSDHPFAGFHPFMPFATLHITRRDQILTALGVVPQWVRLLYWPAHLATEYGPPGIDVAQGPSLTQLPGLIVLASIVGVGFFARRRYPLVSFGVAFTCIALLPSSNFVLPAGIVLAERTLFLPSVGAMFIVGAVAVYAGAVARKRNSTRAFAIAAGVVCSALLMAGTLHSARRSRVWHDTETVFRQGVVDAPLVYRAHYMLGAWAFAHHREREGERELRRALNLFAYDPYVAFALAEGYRQGNRCNAALPMYRWTTGVDKTFSLGNTGFSICLLETGNYTEAKQKAIDAMKLGGDTVALRQVISLADSAMLASRGKQTSAQIAAPRAPSKLPESVQKTTETGRVRRQQ